MTKERLYNRLLFDLRRLKLPIDEVDLYFRPFSKTYYGRYFPIIGEGRPRIFMYPYERNGQFMKYSDILKYTVHEMCHHIQYMDSSFVRLKGVMHDTNFWKLYNHYIKRATKLKMGDFYESKVSENAV